MLLWVRHLLNVGRGKFYCCKLTISVKSLIHNFAVDTEWVGVALCGTVGASPARARARRSVTPSAVRSLWRCV